MHRLMRSDVECQAGFSACDHPTAVIIKGRRKEVEMILAEWRSLQAKCYRLLLQGGQTVQIEFMEDKDWHIQML